MNYLALIGIVDKIKKSDQQTVVALKVQKPSMKPETDKWYDVVEVVCDNSFKSEIESLNKGDVVGVKGHYSNNSCIVERLQIF